MGSRPTGYLLAPSKASSLLFPARLRQDFTARIVVHFSKSTYVSAGVKPLPRLVFPSLAQPSRKKSRAVLRREHILSSYCVRYRCVGKGTAAVACCPSEAQKSTLNATPSA